MKEKSLITKTLKQVLPNWHFKSFDLWNWPVCMCLQMNRKGISSLEAPIPLSLSKLTIFLYFVMESFTNLETKFTKILNKMILK